MLGLPGSLDWRNLKLISQPDPHYLAHCASPPPNFWSGSLTLAEPCLKTFLTLFVYYKGIPHPTKLDKFSESKGNYFWLQKIFHCRSFPILIFSEGEGEGWRGVYTGWAPKARRLASKKQTLDHPPNFYGLILHHCSFPFSLFKSFHMAMYISCSGWVTVLYPHLWWSCF